MASTTVQKNMVFTTKNMFDILSNSQKVDEASNSRNSKVDDASKDKFKNVPVEVARKPRKSRWDVKDTVEVARKPRKSRWDVKDPVEVARNEAMERVKELPSNRGYLVGCKSYYGIKKGSRYHGKRNAIDNDDNFKLIDVLNKRVHIWTRRGHIVKKIDGDNVWDAWNTNDQRLITSVAIRPCPNELKNSGVCTEVGKEEHRKHYYHFSTVRKNKTYYNKHKLVCCINAVRGWKCWEKYNSEHLKVFHHRIN